MNGSDANYNGNINATVASYGFNPNDNALIYGLSRDKQMEVLKDNGYNLPSESINVETFLKNGNKHHLQGKTIFYRQGNKTVQTPVEE